MAASNTSPTSSLNTPTTPSNLSRFVPCSRTFLFTKAKQNHIHDGIFFDTPQRPCVPRVCRLRTNDNAMAIYALVDPTDENMIASDVSVKMLVEQLSEISFENDSYKEKINTTMQQVFFEIENRLLQMTFDHAEEKATSATTTDITADKCLPSLDEAQSGAFLCAATVTHSWVYISYVGTIRTFLISIENNELVISNNRPQFYHVGSLHTIDNDDETLRLRSLNVNLAQVRTEGLDSNHSKYTRCIGKLSEKLLSSAASANDVNEARCSALVCEPKTVKFKKMAQDYALVMMTDKFYQMYLKTVASENSIPTDFAALVRDSIQNANPARAIFHAIEDRLLQMNDPNIEKILSEDVGLLIHFFYQKSLDQSSKFAIRENNARIVVDGEVTVEEVKIFIHKNQELQQKREQNRNALRNSGHKRENQTHTSTIDPFVRFDVYEKALNDNEELCQTDRFITDLLYNKSTADMEESLDQYLREHPSLKCD